MTRRFLAALDTSERAERVLRCAVGLADSLGASLYLLRAVSGQLLHLGEPVARLMLEAEAQLRAFAARTPHLRMQTIVRDSTRPWRAIIDVADEIGADVIVLGSHGYHGIDYLLGTNAGRVANLANCSVLVVHRETDHPHVARER